MIEIIPAILPISFKDLTDSMSLVTGIVPMVQVDVCDGVFVPSKTWPYVKKGDPDFAKILKEEGGFPYWEELDFEADLMVSEPELAAEEWIKAGAKRIVIHFESLKDPKATFEKIRKTLPDEDSFLYTEVGVAINPSTPNEKLEPIMEFIDFVQFMGIEKIGFQGEKFDEKVLEKISRLRAAHPNVTISIDGGVNLVNAPWLLKAGANRLIVGSGIFESDDITDTVENFLNVQEAK